MKRKNCKTCKKDFTRKYREGFRDWSTRRFCSRVCFFVANVGSEASHYKHGMSETRFYEIWQGIKKRCENSNHKSYSRYGGRGIKCLWNSFEEFRDDMYEQYEIHVEKFGEKNTQIDRTNNDGDYSKKNTRWVTAKQQSRNTRRNRLLTFRGETKCVSEWAEELGMPSKILFSRIYRGWSVEETFTTPIRIG